MYCWKRVLKIKLSNANGRSIVFDKLDIRVNGNKYLAAMQDVCVVEIKNLSLSQVVQIIDGKFFDIVITCGYESSMTFDIFDGSVMWISNKLDDTKSNTITLTCGNKAMVSLAQQRLNISFNSGISLYRAASEILSKAGIKAAYIDNKLASSVIAKTLSLDGTALEVLNSALNVESVGISSDSIINGSSVTITSFDTTNPTIIDLTSSKTVIINGYPQMTLEGLECTVLPAFPLKCSEVIKIDNSIIDVSAGNSRQSVAENATIGYQFDKDGFYMIRQINYSLANRSDAFQMTVLARSLSLMKEVAG